MQEKKFQLEIATLKCCNSKFCTREMTISNNMIEFDGEVGQYYGQINCSLCKIINYFLWCECGQHIVSKEPFYDGDFHSCTNTKCRKDFQIVKCPHCFKYNVFENFSYLMGKVTQCFSCENTFQQAACHKCYEDTYFDGSYKEAIPFICSKNCNKNEQHVQHINCPFCKFPNLFNILKPLQTTQCQNLNCTQTFYYLTCQKCQDPIIQNSDRYELGKNYQCKGCKVNNSLQKCMFCNQYNMKISDKKGDYGRYQCMNNSCRKKQIFLKCEKNKCNYLNSIEDKDPSANVFDHTCTGCTKRSFFAACPQCSSGYSLTQQDLSATKVVECQKCQCNIPVPSNINYNLSSNSLECKICFDKPAIYIIDQCNHLFGCEECAENLKKSSNNYNKVKCPICRQQGQIKKIFF